MGVVGSVIGAVVGSLISGHQQRKAAEAQADAMERANQAILDQQKQSMLAQQEQAEKAYKLQEQTAKQNEILQNQASATAVTAPAQTRNAVTSDAHYSGVGGVKEDELFTSLAGLGGDNTLLGGDDDQLF